MKGDVVADTDKLCVALLAGGRSGEREVSLSGAAIFEKALNPDKYKIKRYDPAYDLQYLARDSGEIDFAFILLHGLFGEDGSVQGMLDLLDIPYQGSGILGSAVAMDKNLAKILYRTVDIPVADWYIVDSADREPVRWDDCSARPAAGDQAGSRWFKPWTYHRQDRSAGLQWN